MISTFRRPQLEILKYDAVEAAAVEVAENREVVELEDPYAYDSTDRQKTHELGQRYVEW